MRIGITGHTTLSAASIGLISDQLRALLADQPDLVGVTCLARGADQLFARAVLDLGGRIEVVLPAADYRERKVKPGNLAEFDALLGAAATVRTMPFAESGSAAYMAASEQVLSTVDMLVAVWDGKPAGGHGGTADVVQAARERAIPVTVVWPIGCARE
ncbi:hypothetical protein SAMN05421504_10856 [Amycolatopsis xylanica]|uniref:DNA recombination-mediator protein A n=1 Tax=Amycolatopsis xylanica TaxID=589385 RepID=A0A1H3P7A8_9PSEU|nr:hypothetical protein SAMN05421504_10856 [Amycolatopsis xylanica]